ncbi:mucin-5AC-like [Oncorhynchus mykiss]|uniref:mucin-5AC-like n=1 Tax=Oncorhynchus mykiss TaxID=8022 RepID=UPI001877C9E1|nr:mucin-5AC-like [Oncorhynchus mykiss]XP_036789375.1 mucin-5AC-like [Oncorhynchus mykiss]
MKATSAPSNRSTTNMVVNATSDPVNMSTTHIVPNGTSAPINVLTSAQSAVNVTSGPVTQSNTTSTLSTTTPLLSTTPIVNTTAPSTTPIVNTTATPNTPVVNTTAPPTTPVVSATTSPTTNLTEVLTTPLPTTPVATTPVPTIQVPTTTASHATEAPLTSPQLSLQFSLISIFTISLSNSRSPEFLALANHVTTQLDNLFKAQFGARFFRTVVNSFRSGSIVVDSTLIFNNISSAPNDSLVAQTLQTAITSNTSGLTLPINSSSIVVTRATTMTNATTSAATTAAPTVDVTTTSPAVAKTTTTAVPAATTTTAVPVATTTTAVPAATTTTTGPAAATITAFAPTDPPSSSEGTLILRFSLNEIFTSDLANPSSSAFKALAGKVVSEVNKIFSRTPSFLRSIVNSFKSGSVVTNMTLVFSNKSSVPSACSSQATFTISSTSLNILPGSVNVESSVNSGSAPRPTAFCLAFLPLTLALLMVQLLAN